jgi:hypothetical protein
MEEILDQKDLNITELNHLIYAAATVITEEINGMEQHRQQTQINGTAQTTNTNKWNSTDNKHK